MLLRGARPAHPPCRILKSRSGSFSHVKTRSHFSRLIKLRRRWYSDRQYARVIDIGGTALADGSGGNSVQFLVPFESIDNFPESIDPLRRQEVQWRRGLAAEGVLDFESHNKSPSLTKGQEFLLTESLVFPCAIQISSTRNDRSASDVNLETLARAVPLKKAHFR